MALSINQAVNAFRLAAGEPIFFSYQPQSAAGVAEALTGRKFVFAIYDSVRADRGTYEAETVTTSDPAAVWRLPGTVSEKLLGSTDLQWEISERLDDSRDKIATGTLTIDMSAPSILDYNAAPISRYITRITRLNDPATVDNPVFKVVIRAYTASASVTAPTFSTTPSISPTSGNVGATFTATDGTVANGSFTSRRWLLGGVSIGTGSTVTPTTAGTLTLENTATGTNGSVITSLSSAVTVSAIVIPAPAFTSQPSISPVSGNVGATFTATDATVSNGSVTSRRWLLNGSSIGTASTVAPSSAGTLTLENTATGTNGSTIVATSSAVTVAAIATPTLALSPSTSTIAANASAGTLITAVANVPASVTPTVTPNDGRLVIAGDATNGWKVVVGMSALSAGAVNFTVAATGANSATGTITITAVASSNLPSTVQIAAEGDSNTTGLGGAGGINSYVDGGVVSGLTAGPVYTYRKTSLSGQTAQQMASHFANGTGGSGPISVTAGPLGGTGSDVGIGPAFNPSVEMNIATIMAGTNDGVFQAHDAIMRALRVVSLKAAGAGFQRMLVGTIPSRNAIPFNSADTSIEHNFDGATIPLNQAIRAMFDSYIGADYIFDLGALPELDTAAKVTSVYSGDGTHFKNAAVDLLGPVYTNAVNKAVAGPGVRKIGQPTWSQLDHSTAVTISNANGDAATVLVGGDTATLASGGGGSVAYGYSVVRSGKYCWEVAYTGTPANMMMGVVGHVTKMNKSQSGTVYPTAEGIGFNPVSNGAITMLSSAIAGVKAEAVASGGSYLFCVDADANLLWVRPSTSSLFNGYATLAESNPATGVGGIDISSIRALDVAAVGARNAGYSPCVSFRGAGNFVARFKASTMTTAIPSGFKALDQ